MGFALGVGLALCVAAGGERNADRTPPIVNHTPCAEYQAGVPFTVNVQIEDASRLFDPKVLYRSADHERWLTTPLLPTSDPVQFNAVIPKEELRGVLEYRVEVFDEFGNGPTRCGTPEAPLRVWPTTDPVPCLQTPAAALSSASTRSGPSDVGATEAGATAAAATGLALTGTETAPPVAAGLCSGEAPPFYCTALFWGIVGGVVATTAVVTTVALHPWSGPDGPGVPAEVTVAIEATPPAR